MAKHKQVYHVEDWLTDEMAWFNQAISSVYDPSIVNTFVFGYWVIMSIKSTALGSLHQTGFSLVHKNLHFDPFWPPMNAKTAQIGDNDIPQTHRTLTFNVYKQKKKFQSALKPLFTELLREANQMGVSRGYVAIHFASTHQLSMSCAQTSQIFLVPDKAVP